MSRSGTYSRLMSIRRARAVQLVLTVFATVAITRITDQRSMQQQRGLPADHTFGGLKLHSGKFQSSMAVSPVEAALLAEQRFAGMEGSTQAENFAQQEGSPLPAFNFSACLEQPSAPPAELLMSTEMFLGSKTTRLKPEVHFMSQQRPRQNDITIVVTFDVGRLYMLEGLCLTWGGPVSAAVYQSVVGASRDIANQEGLRDATYRVTDLHARLSEQRTCMLDLMLFSEALAENDPNIKDLFPVNALRNRAMLMVMTTLVLVLDGDLLPQANMRAKLAPGTPRGDALLNGAAAREYHVLPAFDTKSTQLAYVIARGNKAAAVAAYEKGVITRFGSKGSRFPQGCTDYERWKTVTEQYPVVYCNRYEPWGIVARAHSPWFDGRFRGYGRNKIMYAAALNASRFEFVIDPDSFVIHRPHPRSTAQRAFDHETDHRVRDHIMSMWAQQAADGNFSPVVDDVVLRCKQELPWWKGIAMHVGRSDAS